MNERKFVSQTWCLATVANHKIEKEKTDEDRVTLQQLQKCFKVRKKSSGGDGEKAGDGKYSACSYCNI